MKRFAFLLALLTVVSLIGGRVIHAQTTDELRMAELQFQIDALEREASAKRAIIATTHEQQDSLKKAIALIQNQIAAVQSELSATAAKIDKTKIQISSVEQAIIDKRAEMTRKRETIGRMVFYLDRTDQDSVIANLFKYENLSEFVAQVHDLGRVQNEIMNAIADIKDAKESLQQDKSDLEVQQNKLQQLSDEAYQRANQLAGAKGEKARVLTVTKGQEATYQKQLAQIEEQKSAYFMQLRELELKVVSGGLYIVHITASSIPAKGTKLFTAPEDRAYITQGYGCTKYARCNNKRGPYGGAPHNGVDYAAGFGSPIKAIGAGKIVANGLNNSGWGNWIAIQHTNNMVSLYGHMSSFAGLSVGATVEGGQVIGYEGRTGAATGSHLHLSLYKDFFTYIKDANGQLNFNYFDGTLNPLNYM
ncbi:MAG: peptidoglycan DD-metalloendopeptidase family protein [Candidatus Pacebacteria bacterium]|nr:peptidoglycan DD-metalloendopeptidase family protein [Candidatus Paceibacterota bacterium]